MKLEDLKPGSYRVSRDVKGPYPDRRSASDWRKLRTIQKGCVVYVRDMDLSDNKAHYVMWIGSYMSNAVLCASPDWRELTEALEPVTEKPSWTLERLHGLGYEGRAADVLDRLVKSGTITFEQFLAVVGEEEKD